MLGKIPDISSGQLSGDYLLKNHQLLNHNVTMDT